MFDKLSLKDRLQKFYYFELKFSAMVYRKFSDPGSAPTVGTKSASTALCGQSRRRTGLCWRPPPNRPGE